MKGEPNMGILDAVDYVVVEMDGDYGMLRRLDCPQEPLKPVARALLPDGATEGTKLRYQLMEYEILSI